jgi:hypothetical protein
MFKSAVFYHASKQKDRDYEINDIYRYRSKNGNWSCEKLFYHGGKNKSTGDLLKAIDFLMRRQYGFKFALTMGRIPATFQDIIEQEIDKYRESKKQAAAPLIEIDVSRLQDIRDSALKIQNKLIIEEIEATDMPETVSAESARENAAGLNAVEYQFLQCLLYGKEYDALLKDQGALLSVLVDAINDNLFAVFADTVISYDDGKPALIEDYAPELKRIIQP